MTDTDRDAEDFLALALSGLLEPSDSATYRYECSRPLPAVTWRTLNPEQNRKGSTMLTPETLRAMTPADRTQLFTSLARNFYGPIKTFDLVAADMGYTRVTVYKWARDDSAPLPVIYTLDAWVNGQPMQEKMLDDWKGLPAQLSEAAENMAKVAATLAKIAERLPA